MRTNVSPDLLPRLLRYEPDTGKLFWKARTPEMFAPKNMKAEHACARWNSAHAGREAFTADTGLGYRMGDIFNQHYLAHRVIWALQTGEWPKAHIDHRDCDPSNNRWENLREATPSQNQHNHRLSKANTSGVKGVSWHSQTRKWVASICIRGHAKSLGYFAELADAAQAVEAARAQIHGQYGRTL